MKSKTKPEKPMNYGPYVITPPSGIGPFPMWHVRGPSLDMSSTDERSVRMRACEANACYQAGYKAAKAETGAIGAAAPDILAACEAVATQGMAEFNSPDDPIVVLQLTREEFSQLRSAIARAKGGA